MYLIIFLSSLNDPEKWSERETPKRFAPCVWKNDCLFVLHHPVVPEEVVKGTQNILDTS
jgi:hypothetical protein